METQQKLSSIQVRERAVEVLAQLKAKKELQATAHINCTYTPQDKKRARSVLDRLVQLAADTVCTYEISSIVPYTNINEEG